MNQYFPSFINTTSILISLTLAVSSRNDSLPPSNRRLSFANVAPNYCRVGKLLSHGQLTLSVSNVRKQTGMNKIKLTLPSIKKDRSPITWPIRTIRKLSNSLGVLEIQLQILGKFPDIQEPVVFKLTARPSEFRPRSLISVVGS